MFSFTLCFALCSAHNEWMWIKFNWNFFFSPLIRNSILSVTNFFDGSHLSWSNLSEHSIDSVEYTMILDLRWNYHKWFRENSPQFEIGRALWMYWTSIVEMFNGFLFILHSILCILHTRKALLSTFRWFRWRYFIVKLKQIACSSVNMIFMKFIK